MAVGSDTAELLAWRRQKLAKSQVQLAREAGTGQATISRLEQGGRDVRLATLLEVVRALGMDLRIVPNEVLPAVDNLIQGIWAEAAPDAPLYSLEGDAAGEADDEGDGNVTQA